MRRSLGEFAEASRKISGEVSENFRRRREEFPELRLEPDSSVLIPAKGGVSYQCSLCRFFMPQQKSERVALQAVNCERVVALKEKK